MKPHYGFNMMCMVNAEHVQPEIVGTELDFIAEHGFDYIRLPLDYKAWIHDFEYTKPDEKALSLVDGYVEQCLVRGLHANINFHRAPGYCVNRPELEKHNLWTDTIAQDAFVWNWELFARRYAGIVPDKLSFNLVNEPWSEDWGDTSGFTRARHEAVMRRTIAAIRAISPDRDIVLDGINGGNTEMPELADTGTIQSVRGYAPHPLTHYKASWMPHLAGAPVPEYPGICEGAMWNRDKMLDYYRNWRALEAAGTRVMVGEFGCYNKTPHDLVLRWLGDLLSVYREFGWGYVLWNFKGSFGIVDHGRPGAEFKQMNGMNVDIQMLDLLKSNMV